MGVGLVEIVLLAVVFCIALSAGIVIGRHKTRCVGTLYLNKTDPKKEFFEFHFEEDLDEFERDGRISFRLVSR